MAHDPRAGTPVPEGAPVLHGIWRLLTAGGISSLSRRIVLFNLVGLLILAGGIVALNRLRTGLIETRIQTLLTQAEIIAGAIAETATVPPEPRSVDPAQDTVQERPTGSVIQHDLAAPVLARLIVPTQTRARLYGPRGRLILDSRDFATSGQIIAFDLPPVEGRGARAIRWLRELLVPPRPPPVRPGPPVAREVRRALIGETATWQWLNSRGELIVSVAVPVQRFREVQGALTLSTRGGDIDALARVGRLDILRLFLAALGVSVLLSLLLAGAIAEPVRRLAAAARLARAGSGGRVDIPDLTGRGDEIGELSGALRRMTAALYERIDTNERFAADVAHELKNPLTSLASAVDVLARSPPGDDAARLIQIIRQDVRRMDRLISDISEASRIDAEMNRAPMENVNMAALLRAVSEITNDTLPADGPRVELDLAALPAGRGRVRGIGDRLGRVMQNLLDNAVSFSRPGGIIAVRAHLRTGRVVIVVEDQGPGIAPASLDRIFDRFHTDRPDPDAFARHSGLGLSISRQIITAHGGVLRAENRPPAPGATAPQGARFVVELPAAP